MKKILLLVTCYILLAFGVVAQTKEATTSSQPVSSEIQQLKDRLANKVLELTKKDQDVTVGVITDVEAKQLKIRTRDDVDYLVKIDDVLTKFYSITSGQKKETTIDDLGKNSYIIVTGPISEKTISANYIYEDSHSIVGSGKVSEVDKIDSFIRVVGLDKSTYTIDVETSTKTALLDSKTLEVEAIGFSKIKEGDTVHFVLKVTGSEREKNRHSAQRILVIPQEYFIK